MDQERAIWMFESASERDILRDANRELGAAAVELKEVNADLAEQVEKLAKRPPAAQPFAVGLAVGGGVGAALVGILAASLGSK